jgi:phosphoserine phosphatase RsbU/P
MTAGNGDVVDGFIEALLDDDAQTLYDRAPCGYLSTTPDGTIIKANATFLGLTGYERQDLVGRKRFVQLLTAGGRIYHETHYAPMLRMHGNAREIALELVCKDGRRLPVLINSVLERDDFDDPIVIRTAIFDASHRRQYEEELLREKNRAEASEARAIALARTLQQTLIPPHVPDIDGLEVGGEYRPAGDGSEVGGDFYDIFQAGDDDWVVVIGDVCGKGVEAAVVTALARYTLRAAAVQDPSPAHALTVLNAALLGADTDRFCTAAVLRLRRYDGQ